MKTFHSKRTLGPYLQLTARSIDLDVLGSWDGCSYERPTRDTVNALTTYLQQESIYVKRQDLKTTEGVDFGALSSEDVH
jgi:hypothetical protein